MEKKARDLVNICRLCLCEDNNKLIDLPNLLDPALTVQDIERFTDIRIQKEEQIFCVICVDCGNKLKNSATFRVSCRKNDALFKQYSSVLIENFSKDNNGGKRLRSIATALNKRKKMPIDIKRNFSIIDSEVVSNTKCAPDIQTRVKIASPTPTNDVSSIADTSIHADNEIALIELSIDENEIEEPEIIPQNNDDEYLETSSNKDDHLSHGLCTEKNIPESNNSEDHGNELVTTCLSQPSSSRKLRNYYRRCDTCGKMVSNLKIHMVTHTQEKKFTCPYCSIKMNLNSNLQKHIEIVHLKKGPKTCNLCNEEFASYYAYKYHKNSKHKSQDFSCQVCAKKFASSISYATHYSRFHANSNDKQIQPITKEKQLCGICGKMVCQMSSHILTHKLEKKFSCPHCPSKMGDKSNLKRHIQAVHMKKVAKTCEICGKDFVHINLYKYHILSVHEIGNTFDCDICSKKFKTLAKLKSHKIAVHSIERKLACTTCGKLFKVKNALRAHERRMHSADQSYKCNQCPKHFKSAGGRNKHELTHKSNNLACKHCDEKFQSKDLLVNHVKKYTLRM